MSLDFVNLGKHCSLENCHRDDYLPFKCDCCEDFFCAEHRLAPDHSCKQIHKLDANNRVALVCADCETPYSKELGHKCAETKATKLQNKSRPCTFPNCHARGVLVEASMVSCNECHSKFCLKHRHHPQLHNTNSAKAAPATPSSIVNAKSTLKPTTCAESERRENPMLSAALRRQQEQQQQQRVK